MATTHAGLKRKADEEMRDRNLSKSPRIAGPNTHDRLSDDRLPASEDNSNQNSETHDKSGEQRKTDLKDQEIADEFMSQFMVLLDLRRIKTELQKNLPSEFFDAYWAQLRNVCNMFKETELLVNPYVSIPWNAMSDLRNASETLAEMQVQQDEYQKAVEDVKVAIKAKTEAVLANQRQTKLDGGTAFNKADATIPEEAALNQAREHCCRLGERLWLMQVQIEEECNFSLNLAENYFVTAGFLQPAKHRTTREEQQTEQPEVHGSNILRRTDSDGHAPSATQQLDLPPRPMAEIVQEEKREALRKAEQAVWDADHSREEARRHYKRDVREFLEANKDQKVIGTKEEFDRDFLMIQMEFTRNKKYAEEELERVKEAALIVGALEPEETMSEFGDPADPFGGASNCGDDPVWQLRESEIRSWVDFEAERLFEDGREATVGEDDWSVVDREEDPGGSYIEPFGDGLQPYLDAYVEEPQLRKMIDGWWRQQEKLRASMMLREPYWWEVCTGI